MTHRIRLLTLTIAALWLASLVSAEEVRVAVAANFTAPMKALTERFERESGHKVTASFGSTGQFYAQIKNGAPFDVFLSADEERPVLLEQEGLTATGSRFTYAVGKLVLWSATPGLVDDKGAVLKGGAFGKVAVANPKTAPYGAASMEAIASLGLTETLAPKIVQGQDIGQTFQFALTGNAELAFVALSQVLASEQAKGTRYWEVPQNLYTPLTQQAVLLASAKDNPAAQALIAFLRSEPVREQIRGFGYGLE